jgi:hypothetical protein
VTDHHTHDAQADQGGDRGHGGHGWMMIVCCIPMIVIAVALVATGAASPGFLLVAITCVAMMALMMGGMGHGDGPDENRDHSADAGRW